MSKQNLTKIIKQGLPQEKFVFSEKQVQAIKSLSHILLIIVAIAGAITLSAAAPKMFKLFDQLYWANQKLKGLPRGEKYKRQFKIVQRSFYYLREKGYVDIKPLTEGDFKVTLKQKGRKKIINLNYETLTIAKPSKWNGKWWLVLADIPVKSRYLADKFRAKIKQLNFYPLQRTVWLFPYDPTDEILFISGFLKIDQFVTLMRVDEMNPGDEKKAKRFFRDKELI